MPKNPREKLRFIAAALSSDTEDCIEWPWGKTNGYAQFRRHGRTLKVHRIVCERAHGAPTFDGAHAAHYCGNRACINPAHLRWATALENSADQVMHGTRRVVLADREVIEMRLRFAMGETMFALQQEFPGTTATISCAIRGKTFAHLPFAVF